MPGGQRRYFCRAGQRGKRGRCDKKGETKLFQEAELYYENGKKTSIEQVKQYIGDGIIEEGKSDTDESTSDISFTIEVETNSELEKSDTSTDEDKQRNEFNKRIIRERKCKKKLFFKKKKKEE